MPQTKSWTGHEKLTELNHENPIQSPVPQGSQQLKKWENVKVIDIHKIYHTLHIPVEQHYRKRGQTCAIC